MLPSYCHRIIVHGRTGPLTRKNCFSIFFFVSQNCSKICLLKNTKEELEYVFNVLVPPGTTHLLRLILSSLILWKIRISSLLRHYFFTKIFQNTKIEAWENSTKYSNALTSVYGVLIKALFINLSVRTLFEKLLEKLLLIYLHIPSLTICCHSFKNISD